MSTSASVCASIDRLFKLIAESVSEMCVARNVNGCSSSRKLSLVAVPISIKDMISDRFMALSPVYSSWASSSGDGYVLPAASESVDALDGSLAESAVSEKERLSLDGDSDDGRLATLFSRLWSRSYASILSRSSALAKLPAIWAKNTIVELLVFALSSTGVLEMESPEPIAASREEERELAA
ncbi:hypothetical protein OGATHE_003163 [Ogataea polymorpha]|uniref:Uncharacterized protein n=1 Tax=Ogataea polymorpha TaxID=460523 RepID=A0A9P8T701_9ASCO|nr:hypothetical protein OGATHE_003163 [Ogataea polymorpha]